MPIMDNLPQSCIPILASAFFLWAQPSQAEVSDSSADYYFQEFPVVLTASRLSQPLSEAPSAMTVIDREMIKASGFRSVPELMRLVPGMYVGYADANRPVVSFHGATDEFSRRMQILIDGRSAYLPPFGGVNWADLPLQIEDIERIEVVRGPSSASHGTNSFYGVINVITRDALSQVGGSVSVTGGDASDVSARFGKAGEQFDYRLSVGYRSDQGIDNAILNDHNRTRLFNFRGNYHPNATDSLDVQLGASDGVYGLGVAGRPEDALSFDSSINPPITIVCPSMIDRVVFAVFFLKTGISGRLPKVVVDTVLSSMEISSVTNFPSLIRGVTVKIIPISLYSMLPSTTPVPVVDVDPVV